MIDLHCHILPGMDDGAESFPETEKMLEKAAASGVEVLAATSHYSHEGDQRYEETFEKARVLAEKHSITLLKGMEYDLQYIAEVPREKLRTVGETEYLLVDMNCNYIVHSMPNLFFELKLAGFQIVFAHPERMLPAKDLEILLKLLDENAIPIQLDMGSLTGRYGPLARKNAFHILDRGNCHLLGSDAHKAHHFQFEECRDLLEKRYGQGLFELLAEENPSALLSGKEMRSSPRRKTFWDKLFRRGC
ncbi:MAG: hypothetical protein J6A21_04470 [Lentisphaeria bacterium]|nr:hypothetical protein [Lentisphaeria bacterium]